MTLITRADAQAQGLKWFCTGKPCKHGHLAERYTSDGHCRICQQDNARGTWRRRHLALAAP